MNEKIQKDLYRYVGNQCKKKIIQLRYIFFTPGFTFIWAWRHAKLANNPISKLFWRIIHLHFSFKYGIQIPIKTQIGEGFRIVHYGTIVINENTIIGKNFNISEGALIGNAQGKKKGVPIIGDNVCMNANAIIVGNAHIGNNVLIAPGAFINFNVPDNSIVIGNPGKIISRQSSPTEKYIVYDIKNFKQ